MGGGAGKDSRAAENIFSLAKHKLSKMKVKKMMMVMMLMTKVLCPPNS